MKPTITWDNNRFNVEPGLRHKGPEMSKISSHFSVNSVWRCGRRNKSNFGQLSFSNTTREEKQHTSNAQAEALVEAEEKAILPQGNYITNRPSASAKRTRSRFREDLSDFGSSPPEPTREAVGVEPASSHPRSGEDM